MYSKNSEFVLDDNNNVFVDVSYIDLYSKPLKCTLYDKPLMEFVISIIFLMVIYVLVGRLRIWIAVITFLCSLIFFIIKKRLLIQIYDDSIVLYCENNDKRLKALLIKNNQLLTWEIINNQLLEIYYNDANGVVHGVKIPIHNVLQTEITLNKYFSNKYSVKQRVNSFVERVKTGDGKTMYQKVKEKLKR